MIFLDSEVIKNTIQVDIMRQIYNDNLDTLSTTFLPYRTYDEQQSWWDENKDNLDAFLYKESQDGQYVAFLVLTNRGNFKTPIIAIKKDYWGKGFGKYIIEDYIKKANSPLAGSQLQSNGAICHLNKKIGWEIVGTAEQPNGTIDLLFHPGINKNVNLQNIREEIINYLNKKYK